MERLRKLKNLIDETKTFLKVCEAYCDDETELNEESKTFKFSIKIINEKLLEIEKCI